jgi:raffinose/stachyose/melibiose transport system permease protein
MNLNKKNRWSTIISFIVLLIWAIAILVPLFIMLSAAVKSPEEQATNPFGWPQKIQWETFRQAWTDAKLARGLGNSVILVSFSLVLIVMIGSMAAYPLARRTKWKPVYLYFLAGIMMPFQLAMLPLYRLMKMLELINTYAGGILIYVAISLPMVIFLYTGFIKGINHELEEAAMVDGANRFRIFWQIIFPLLKPVTSTVLILNIMSLWNDFFIVLLFLPKKEMRTLQLAIFSFIGEYNTRLNLVMASVILSILPLVIVFMALQKHFIKGMAGGAVKG